MPQGMTKNILQAEITHAGVFYLVKAETDGSYEESKYLLRWLLLWKCFILSLEKMNIISR